MEILKVSESGLTEPQLSKVVAILSKGEVIMHATETCYGLAVDPLNKEGLERLYAIKQMERDKPVSIMVRNVNEAQKYAEFSDLALRMAQKFWPGPVTLIVPRTGVLPAFFNEGVASIGIRCPDHALTQSILEAFDGPLVTTSANKTGTGERYSVSSLDIEPSFVLDSGDIPRNLPSSLIRIEGDRWEILRPGDMKDEIEQFLSS